MSKSKVNPNKLKASEYQRVFFFPRLRLVLPEDVEETEIIDVIMQLDPKEEYFEVDMYLHKVHKAGERYEQSNSKVSSSNLP